MDRLKRCKRCKTINGFVDLTCYNCDSTELELITIDTDQNGIAVIF